MAKDNLNTIENHNSSGVYAIILSAGYSSRMGEFKPLLSVGGEPAIVRLANAFKNAGVNNVIAVT
ncbi:MAG TPA: NTP transferase domain-containing protein, partial [Anaerovoracaceae bacterium]|nr:NTP transferase domain-containing protein [Anaerovoracaceae bacterium]